MTALLWAADMGNLEVLQLLVARGASLDAVDDNGLTALLWAADRGHVACVTALLDANIDVNAVDKVPAIYLFFVYVLFVDKKSSFGLLPIFFTELVHSPSPLF